MKGSERNLPCECGSGTKAKRCLCRVIATAHEEALREAEWRSWQPTAEQLADINRRRRSEGRRSLMLVTAIAGMFE